MTEILPPPGPRQFFAPGVFEDDVTLDTSALKGIALLPAGSLPLAGLRIIGADIETGDIIDQAVAGWLDREAAAGRKTELADPGVGCVAFSVEIRHSADAPGESLQWEAHWSEIDNVMGTAANILYPIDSDRRRQVARQTVVKILEEGLYTQMELRNLLATIVTWLIFRHEAGPAMLADRRLRFAGLIIRREPDDDAYGFSEVVGV